MEWVIIIIVAVIIGVIVQASINGGKKKEAISEIQQWMNSNGFKNTSEFSYYDMSIGGYTLYIDEINKNLLILNLLNKSKFLLAFKNIIGMEIIEDGVSSNGVGRAVAGGVLFGGAGAVVGAITGKKTVKTMAVVIYMNNISNPKLELILNKDKTKTDTLIYKQKMEFARRIDATIRAIISTNENDNIQRIDMSKTSILTQCPSCKESVEGDFRFCERCGQPLR